MKKSIKVIAVCFGILTGITSAMSNAASSFQGTRQFNVHNENHQPALKVYGPAGAEVDVWFEENTYWAKNRSSRKVKVKLGRWSALVNPGQTFKFMGFGSGIQYFEGEAEAFYEN